MNLKVNQGHRQTKLRSGELPGADKADMMPKQLSVTQGPKATAPSLPRFTCRLSGKTALSWDPNQLRTLYHFQPQQALLRLSPELISYFFMGPKGHAVKKWVKRWQKINCILQYMWITSPVRSLHIMRQVRNLPLYQMLQNRGSLAYKVLQKDGGAKSGMQIWFCFCFGKK